MHDLTFTLSSEHQHQGSTNWFLYLTEMKCRKKWIHDLKLRSENLQTHWYGPAGSSKLLQRPGEKNDQFSCIVWHVCFLLISFRCSTLRGNTRSSSVQIKVWKMTHRQYSPVYSQLHSEYLSFAFGHTGKQFQQLTVRHDIITWLSSLLVRGSLTSIHTECWHKCTQMYIQ